MTRTTRFACTALIIAFSFMAGCAASDEEMDQDLTVNTASWNSDRPTFVLVHGAFQDSSAWDLIRPLLRLRGYKVVTVDLPGRGSDTTPPGMLTLDDHVAAVAAVVAAEPRPVILVGHSFGGITISQVAERMPERIQSLVYLSAYLPRDGESLFSLSQEDHSNGFNENNFLVAPDFSVASVLEQDRLSIFCADCGPIMQHKLLSDFHDEPLPPMTGAVSLTRERFGATAKVYIETLRDNAISTAMQELMLERTPVDQVFELDTSHSPFYTRPRELAKFLASIP